MTTEVRVQKQRQAILYPREDGYFIA